MDVESKVHPGFSCLALLKFCVQVLMPAVVDKGFGKSCVHTSPLDVPQEMGFGLGQCGRTPQTLNCFVVLDVFE